MQSLDNPMPVGGDACAGSGVRLVARIVDAMLFLAAFSAVAFIIPAVSDPAVVGRVELIVLFLIAAILYEVILIALKGQTVGKMALSIRVVRLDNGLVPGWRGSFIRGFPVAALCLLPVIGWIVALLSYASVLGDDRRRGWHDKAAKTLVVRG